jgi:hypothetical protein
VVGKGEDRGLAGAGVAKLLRTAVGTTACDGAAEGGKKGLA